MGLKNQHPERAAAASRLIVQLARLTENIAITALCLKIQTPLVAWDKNFRQVSPVCLSRRSGRLPSRRGRFSVCGKPVQKSRGERLLGISAYLNDRLSVA